MMTKKFSPNARSTLAASFASFEWDFLSGKITATADLARLFGLPLGKTEINIEHLVTQVHTRDISMVRAALSRAVTNGGPIDIQFRVVSNARVRWLCMKAEIHYGNSLTPDWASGIAFDISTLKAAGDELDVFRSRVDAFHKLIAPELWSADGDRRRVQSSFWKNFAGGLDVLDFDRVVHPSDLSEIRQIWNEAASVKSSFKATFRALSISGQYIWLRMCGSPITLHDGMIEEWVGAVEDVSDQFSLEDQLHTSVEWLKLSRQVAGLTGWSDTTERLDAPLASLADTGAITSLEQTMQTVHADYRERVRRAVDAVYDTGETVELDYPTTTDGTWRRFKARRVISHRHLKRSVVGVTLDVTALKATEEINAEMRETARRFERVAAAVFLATDGFVFNTNAQWEIEDPTGWALFTGQEQSEACGVGWQNSCHPSDRDAFRAAIRRCIVSGGASRFKALIRFRDGSYKPVVFGAQPFMRSDEVTGWTLACVVLSGEKSRDDAIGSTQPISGHQVRAARALLQWTVKDLAKRSGVSASTIRRFEDHETSVSIRPSLLDVLKSALQREGIRFFSGDGVGRAS